MHFTLGQCVCLIVGLNNLRFGQYIDIRGEQKPYTEAGAWQTSLQQTDRVIEFFITVVQRNKSKGSCCFQSLKKSLKFYRCSIICR